MKNADLYKALKDCTRASLALLINSTAELPTVTRAKSQATGPGGFSHYFVDETDWSMLVVKNIEGIKHLKEYDDVDSVLQKDATLAKQINGLLIGPFHSGMRFDLDNFLYYLLSKLLREQNGMDFKEPLFDALYENIENYFYRETVEYRYFSPLEQFEMEEEKVDLGNGVCIIKISEEEKEQMFSQARDSWFSPYSFSAFSEYAFELYATTPKLFARDGEDSDILLKRPSGTDAAETNSMRRARP